MTNPIPRLSLRELVKEDWIRHDRSWSHPGFQALAIYRFGVWSTGLPRGVRMLASWVYELGFRFVRNVYGIEIRREASIGRRVRLSHASGGMTIHWLATIGDDCVIRQNVTIGGHGAIDDAPTLGRRVSVSPGAVILGRITIGDDARIGPNAVVMSDIPAGASVVAPASRVVTLPADRRVSTVSPTSPPEPPAVSA